MIREIRGLREVRVLDGRPGTLPPPAKARGAKARGVAFESAVAASEGFGRAARGVWFGFTDAAGAGFAQPDFVFPGAVPVVAEVKLTWRTEAYKQLRGLYWPLLRLLLGVPVGGIVVCKQLTRDTPRGFVVEDLATALAIARSEPGVVPVLHLPFVGDVSDESEARRGRRNTKARPPVPSWWRRGDESEARPKGA